MFGMSYNGATMLSLPATFATGFGFIWSYGRMMEAMAESKLLPSIFTRKNAHGAPWMCLLVGSSLGYGICFILFYNEYVMMHMFGVCLLFAFTAYIAQSVGYIFMRAKLNEDKAKFRSPMGVWGAYFSILAWGGIAITVIVSGGTEAFDLIMYIVVMSVMTIYYYLYAKSRQTFSEDEHKVLFTAHVANCKYALIFMIGNNSLSGSFY
jgi:ethanolamine permease